MGSLLKVYGAVNTSMALQKMWVAFGKANYSQNILDVLPAITCRVALFCESEKSNDSKCVYVDVRSIAADPEGFLDPSGTLGPWGRMNSHTLDRRQVGGS